VEDPVMKLATFNINGIKARIEALPAWLAEAAPDVVCLQEIKSVDEGFPRDLFEGLGYQVETHGQKGFNGVAILSKLGLSDVRRGLPGDETDEQARWIEAVVDAGRPVRVCGLYLPNGNPAPGPKYDYKLAWMARMERRLRELLAAEECFVCLGDYNVIPQGVDAAKPEAWVTDALFLPESRAAFQRMANLGLTDAIRVRDPSPGVYTFWDYQAGAWERNNGIRIDHVMLSPQAADRLEETGIDKAVRGREKPSDHVPVWVRIAA
jgi:exodeoxyribonuclease III